MAAPPFPPDERRCVKRKRNGERCQRWAIQGTTVCYSHGGAAPQVRRKAAERVALAKAQKAVATYGLPRDIDPHAALLEELHRTAGHVSWLGVLVATLDQQDLKQRELSRGGIMFEAPAVWVELYQRERKHLADVARACISAGIEERRVRLAEAQGELLAAVIRGILIDLGVASRPEVPGIVRKHLTLVAGSAS